MLNGYLNLITMFHNIKTVAVELQIDTASTLQVFNFSTQNFLRAKEIVSLEILTPNDVSLTPLGFALPDISVFSSAYLTLYGANPENKNAFGDWVQKVPFYSMHRIDNGTDPYVRDLFTLLPRNIVWEKSTISIGTALGNSGGPVSFLLNVGYIGNQGDN